MKNKNDFGELRWRGQQVVGPGSTHPDTGKKYKVEADLPIRIIMRKDLVNALRDYIGSQAITTVTARRPNRTPTLQFPGVDKLPPCIRNCLTIDLQDGRHRTYMLVMAFLRRFKDFTAEDIFNVLAFRHFGVCFDGYKVNPKIAPILRLTKPLTNTSLTQPEFIRMMTEQWYNPIFDVPRCEKIRSNTGGFFGGAFGLKGLGICSKECELYDKS